MFFSKLSFVSCFLLLALTAYAEPCFRLRVTPCDDTSEKNPNEATPYFMEETPIDRLISALEELPAYFAETSPKDLKVARKSCEKSVETVFKLALKTVNKLFDKLKKEASQKDDEDDSFEYAED